MNRCTMNKLLARSVLLLMLGVPVIASGQSDQPTLDELLELAPAESTEPTMTQPGSEATDEVSQTEELLESVDEVLNVDDAADVFEQAVDEMDRVSRRLGRSFDAGVETQRMQESILRKLDQVIKAAKQQNSGADGSSGGQREQDQGAEQLARQAGQGQDGQPQGTGRQASSGAAGSTAPIEPENQDAAIEQLRKEWGVLPPRVREELSDGLRERFSPLYRRMTEAYYKALAEQE